MFSDLTDCARREEGKVNFLIGKDLVSIPKLNVISFPTHFTFKFHTFPELFPDLFVWFVILHNGDRILMAVGKLCYRTLSCGLLVEAYIMLWYFKSSHMNR